jgi:riboflavin kinase/FMN adenylyltransferase
VEVIRGHQHAPAWRGSAVAIGNFDGVHRGHRALLARARELAEAHDAKAIALTFDPHPAAVLAAAPAKLCSLERRLELMAETGLDAVVVEPFTRELASCAPHAFIDDIVVCALRARAIVVGYDFNYGHGRAGTTEALRAHGARKGIEVAVLPAVEIDGEVASSSRIRSYLRAGELESATRLLGRRWDVDGVVVHGAKRGRALGIPTANIEPASDLPIPMGIYAVTLATRGGTAMPAVASLGTNPTFVDSDRRILEVHVLDFDADLYDRDVRIAFAAKLRDEARFASADALVAQIHADIAAARRLL